MQRGSMQGLGSSLELSRPRGRRDRLPFPEHHTPRGRWVRLGCTLNGCCQGGGDPSLDESHLNTESNGRWGWSGERGRKSTGREDVR